MNHNNKTHQEISNRQVYQHRVDPRASRVPSASQQQRQHRNVADRRDDHEDAVSDDADDVTLVEAHVDRQIVVAVGHWRRRRRRVRHRGE